MQALCSEDCEAIPELLPKGQTVYPVKGLALCFECGIFPNLGGTTDFFIRPEIFSGRFFIKIFRRIINEIRNFKVIGA